MKRHYSTPENFWSKVDKTGDNGKFTYNGSPCWLWMAARDRHGYGKAASGKRSRFIRAHRKSWELSRGPIPTGKLILHHCDNPPCVNDEHLFVGTHKDNSQDMSRKDRGGTLKLSQASRAVVRCMHGMGMSISHLAEVYDVTWGCIWFIVNPDYIAPSRRKAS